MLPINIFTTFNLNCLQLCPLQKSDPRMQAKLFWGYWSYQTFKIRIISVPLNLTCCLLGKIWLGSLQSFLSWASDKSIEFLAWIDGRQPCLVPQGIWVPILTLPYMPLLQILGVFSQGYCSPVSYLDISVLKKSQY